MSDLCKMKKIKMPWFANRLVEQYEDDTEPKLFPDQYTQYIEKQAYDKLEAENQKMKEALLKADWLHDHIFGKAKRVDWGKTFDINWGKINEALMSVSQAVARFKNEKDEV